MQKMKTLIVAACASAPFALPQVSVQANELKMPESMAQYVEYHLDGEDLGEWVNHGTTKAMWEGIPAGIKYTNRSVFELTEDRSQFRRAYAMKTEEGKVISTGTSMTYWDEKLGHPVQANSGYDMGKPYSGTAILEGLNEDTISWKYTETSQGKTTTYLVSQKRVDANTRIETVKKADGSSSPWESTVTRVNSLKGSACGL